MIVASFYAFRQRKWGGIDYDAILRVLDASCARLGLRHVVISDEERPGLQTFVCPLPENLMQAILSGLTQFLEQTTEPVLFVGADSVLTALPPPTDADIAITLDRSFVDCEMNTGYMLCNRPSRCAPVYRAALDREPTQWGQDQTALYAEILDAEKRGALTVERLQCRAHNWAPDRVEDDAGMPTVVHFRAERKRWMGDWARRHVGLQA